MKKWEAGEIYLGRSTQEGRVAEACSTWERSEMLKNFGSGSQNKVTT